MKKNRNDIIYEYEEDYSQDAPSVTTPFEQNGSSAEFPVSRLPIRPEWLLIKWVAPFIVAVFLAALGIHLGATGADAWYTRSVLWMVRFLSGL
jgi:hypothetical protein